MLPRKKNTSMKSDGKTPGAPLPYFKKGNEQREEDIDRVAGFAHMRGVGMIGI